MMKIVFFKTPKMHDGHFSKEYLKDQLMFKGLDDENFMHNVVGEHYEGSAGFMMYIDGKPVLGNEEFGFSYSLNGVLRGLNNAFYDAIKFGEGETNLHVYSGCRPAIIKLKRIGNIVNFSGPEANPVLDLNDKSTELKQAAEELIKITKEYRDIWRQVVSEIKPSFLEEVMKRVFSNRFDGKKSVLKNGVELPLEEIKKEDREPYSIWMPLESALKEISCNNS